MDDVGPKRGVALKLSSIIAVSGNANKGNLPCRGTSLSRADRVGKIDTSTVAALRPVNLSTENACRAHLCPWASVSGFLDRAIDDIVFVPVV